MSRPISRVCAPSRGWSHLLRSAGDDEPDGLASPFVNVHVEDVDREGALPVEVGLVETRSERVRDFKHLRHLRRH